jgi:hypothetical protein
MGEELNAMYIWKKLKFQEILHVMRKGDRNETEICMRETEIMIRIKYTEPNRVRKIAN